jgi:Protein of unknown function (DUF3154).
MVNPIANITEGLVRGIGSTIDELFSSDEEMAIQARERLKLLMQPQIIQALTNLESAKHPNWFVSGGRPALIWICAGGLAWEFIVRQFVAFGLYTWAIMSPEQSAAANEIAQGLPSLDTAQITGLVLALLGLSGIRGIEKLKGVARS